MGLTSDSQTVSPVPPHHAFARELSELFVYVVSEFELRASYLLGKCPKMICISKLRGLSPCVVLELNTVQDKLQALSLSSERKDGLFAPPRAGQGR